MALVKIISSCMAAGRPCKKDEIVNLQDGEARLLVSYNRAQYYVEQPIAEIEQLEEVERLEEVDEELSDDAAEIVEAVQPTKRGKGK
jgi:hypothetical protein